MRAVLLEKKGFTLIELIIVVAILGILAIGLITALNPIEQINRASDSSRRSLATDLTNSFNRFHASRNYSAACSDSLCGTYVDSLTTTTPVTVSTMLATNTNLNTAGETKSATSYTSHQQSTKVFVSLANTSPLTGATIVLCWQPQSKAQKSNANIADANSTVFNNLGVLQTAAACPALSTNACYQCVKQ